MAALGNTAICGTLICDTLEAKNSTPTDPHKITGDLEVTGNLKVDGGIEIDTSGFKGVILNSHSSINQCTIDMNDNTQTWGISADGSSSQLSFSHQLNGAGSGAEIAGLTHTAGVGFGAYFIGNPFRIESIPTSAAGLPANSVWSNGGVLNITPP
jgi:hypothetical protein